MTQKEIKEQLNQIEDMCLLEKKVFEFLNNGITEKVLSKFINKINKHKQKIEKINKLKQYEEEKKKSYEYVVGIDEVGRGPLAGPVVASAVMMKTDSFILDVDDSKKLTEEKREAIFDEIKNDAKYVGIGMVDPKTIDEKNILNATFIAMKQAFDALGIDEKKTLVLIDGNMKNPLINAKQEAIVKGDAKCYSISCASIIAKVTRDRMMNELDSKYPEYDFIGNKGYGTPKHLEALKKSGKINGIHRESFIKNLNVFEPK